MYSTCFIHHIRPNLSYERCLLASLGWGVVEALNGYLGIIKFEGAFYLITLSLVLIWDLASLYGLF